MNVPSENNLLKVLGILKATKKTSARTPVPKKIAIKISLKYPSNLLIIVKKPNVPVDLSKFINHISLNFTLFVHLLSEMKKTKIDHYTDKEALEFHSNKKPGKIEIVASKSMITKRDLALAYSPGVAVPVKKISEDPEAAYDYTSKGNLVAVISNGSAILGMGDLGALASKPVMEGKAVLFKRFADIDSIDLEIDSNDTDEIVNSIKNFSPSFGGINLEDIAAPDCFVIEERLKEILDIPVFHDDQHGTAIITTAALINALDINKKKLIR